MRNSTRRFFAYAAKGPIIPFAKGAIIPFALLGALVVGAAKYNGGPVDCPDIGDTCSDGTVNAGASPDTGQTLFVTPKDAPGTLNWPAAQEYADELDANSHTDWRLPSIAELDVLYRNRDKGALKGTFDEKGSSFAGWYWSSNVGPVTARMKRFSDGYSDWSWVDRDASVRPVRLEPRP